MSVRRIVVVLFERFTVLDAYGPVQAFGSSYRAGEPLFEIATAASRPGPVRSEQGPSTIATQALAAVGPCDVLLVPGGFGTRTAVDDAPFLEQLTAAAARAGVVASVCTGAALLARAGLLDGRPATSNKLAWEWVV